MPRYFFDVVDGLTVPDMVGTVLRDLDCARTEALRLIQEFVTEDFACFASGGPWRMDVTDDWGLLLLRLPFGSPAAPDPPAGA